MNKFDFNEDIDYVIHDFDLKYDSKKDIQKLLIQNAIGFSAAVALNRLRGENFNINNFNKLLIYVSAAFIFIDNLIINSKRTDAEIYKFDAQENMKELIRQFRKNNAFVEQKDILDAFVEEIDDFNSNYYIFDAFDRLLILSRVDKYKGLRRNNIEYSVESFDGELITLKELGTLSTNKEGISKLYSQFAEIPKKDNVNIGTYYEAEFTEYGKENKIFFYKNNDDIKIVDTIGEISEYDESTKYISLGLLLQDLNDPNLDKIRSKIKNRVLQN